MVLKEIFTACSFTRVISSVGLFNADAVIWTRLLGFLAVAEDPLSEARNRDLLAQVLQSGGW